MTNEKVQIIVIQLNKNDMNIFKITIATIILSQSAFAGYGKAIVGGAVAGATASIVSNTLSTKQTTNENSNNAKKCSGSNGGEINIKCGCNQYSYLRAIKRIDGSTTFHCIRNNKLGRTLLSTQKEVATFISVLTASSDSDGYCEIM